MTKERRVGGIKNQEMKSKKIKIQGQTKVDKKSVNECASLIMLFQEK